ncbi:MAG: Ig-like domain-containing protein, partial [Gemmataceae bacterium]|nr:Ig-like domain-containing protein [Gemmataceae bacterium]
MQRLRHFLLALSVCGMLDAASVAQEVHKSAVSSDAVALPPASEVVALSVTPTVVALKGQDDSAQLVVTGQLKNGRKQDLTGDVQYTVANPALARVTTAGRILPLANGTTEITATYGDKTVKLALTTEAMDVNLPINFTNHIVPIFTKLGCNGGGCHGKSGGQNGFALSLLGFVPELDYQTLVKENRGRRLFPAAPDSSLLLTKATGQVAHAGGKRMEVGSDEYKLIRRWIASGMPFGNEKDPVIVKITVEPAQSILTRNNRQQIRVIAHYSDNSTLDVTQRAQYESNDTEIAVVDGAGLVRSLEMSGEAAIMARYQ